MRSWNKIAVAALAAFALPVALMSLTGQVQAADTNAPAPTQIIAPAQVNLPPTAAKALQMSEAGMSDGLIISYIQKSATPYALDADQIVYLHDLGVSSAVLQALVQHASAADSQPAQTINETPPAQNISATETPPVSGAAADYYNALAPYGTWLDVPAYGWCWQPTVVVVNPAWQPYCNNGSWLWTDQGWYWNSYYSWGWAPFHYGRWCRYPGYGWLWRPDNVWGPAWVCWRDYPGYCGWAPLPPGAYFTAGIGWTFNGIAVGFNYGFGLGPQCFTFCDYDHFCGRHPFGHFRYGRDADRFFRGSRVNNDFALSAHHRFINRGIAPSRIEAVTHSRIRQVSIREWPRQAGRSGNLVMPDRLTRSGNTPVIYRPGRDIAAVQNHFRSGRNALSAGQRDGFRAPRSFAARPEVGSLSRLQTSRPNGLPRPAPAISRNHSYRNTFNQQRNGVGNFQARQFQSAPAFHQNYSYARRFTPASHSTPAQHFAPAWHPAPAFHSTPDFQAAPAWHPAPSFHTAPAIHAAPAWHSAPSHSWGGGARVGGATHFGGGAAHFGGGRAAGHGFHR